MQYRSTSAIPTNRERAVRDIDFDDADGATKDIWIPSNGKKIYLNDVVLSIMNKHATGYVIVAVQVYAAGTWQTLAIVSVKAQDSANFAYNFGERIHSAAGDGSAARIRMAKMGTSTSWESHGVVTGESGKIRKYGDPFCAEST